MIRKLKSGANRLYSRKERYSSERRDLGTFRTRQEAEEQEREVLFLNGFERQACCDWERRASEWRGEEIQLLGKPCGRDMTTTYREAASEVFDRHGYEIPMPRATLVLGLGTWFVLRAHKGSFLLDFRVFFRLSDRQWLQPGIDHVGSRFNWFVDRNRRRARRLSFWIWIWCGKFRLWFRWVLRCAHTLILLTLGPRSCRWHLRGSRATA